MRSKTVKYRGQLYNYFKAARKKKGNETMKIKGTKIINLLLASAMTVSCFGQAIIASAEDAQAENYMLYDAEFDSAADLENMMVYFPNNNTEEKTPAETCIKDGSIEVSSDTGFRYKRLAVLPNITDIAGKNIYLETKFKYTQISDAGALHYNFIDVGGTYNGNPKS